MSRPRRVTATPSFRCTLAFSSLLIAFSIHGQATSRVVVFVGACEGPMTMVLNGDEGNRFPISPDDRKQLTGTWQGQGEFTIKEAVASLRLGGRRTGCRKATAEPDPHAASRYHSLAAFRFACDLREAWKVRIDARSKLRRSVPFAYVRRLEKDLTAHDPEDQECFEFGVANGIGEAADVRFPNEEFRILLGEDRPPGRDSLGLLVKALPQTPEQFHTADGLVFALSLQRAAGKDQSAPGLSPIAIDLDARKLKKDMELIGLYVTVSR
jgi:hypothetical protein